MLNEIQLETVTKKISSRLPPSINHRVSQPQQYS